ncbi:MAG: FAD-dependent oxidoreductase, partial [Propionibacteriales bacterium]|nr:FAD-dependent oxidoreductase [Propionibacteriales bacterium]
RAPVFAGLAGGVGQLPTAVAEASGATIHLNSTVRELERTESGWRLVVGPTVAAEQVEVDAVIVATPGPATARLIATAAPTAAYGIGGIDYASMAIITLALPTGGFAQPLVGSGFLVPPVDGKAVKAATFSTNKWGWLADAAGPDLTLLRCSIGRAGEATLLHRDDPELIAAALGDLREAVGATGEPVDAHVQRWGGALPQYNVGHRDRVDAVTADVATVPGLELCGAAYAGVGIPAVIANAQGAAVRLLERLGTIGI